MSGLATSLLDSGQTTTAEAVLFWTLGPIMVLSALGLLFAKKAVHAALAVVVVMISLAFLYVAQDAVFLGVVQVVVYTGAVMMLFLFVLMLVGVDSSDSLVETIRGQRWIGLLAGVGLAAVLVGVVGTATYGRPFGFTPAVTQDNPAGVARIIFGQYVFAFEVVGALLVTAALGALVLTHRQRLTPRVGQRERADARVAAGATLTPLPAPGVYARHNAMDVPALGPDGQPLDISVPRVLRIRGQEADAAEFAARTARVLEGASQVRGGRGTPPPQAVPEGAPVNAPDLGAAVSDSGQNGPSTGPAGVIGQEDGK
ncbi:NADH-quinone oxidoreductase subunit J [Cellulomonas fengjieae]|uniref:NADH-quinone oxidoreductase subunit J n=1 Tax=Cellulomonas fengjieae TaxID=2819978 RepID=A0ABS3SCN6_9CELL|nr:NADH-quinone oxidoreductase subunit J [Cellulomonas fengjieae]MBO3083501.1 NADH-quinone oxidoreductase subunit J [Cellulomonas fengjieae]QVI65175.1 NADH-quinone oxidoreductase subunit J [Cellulomonas fengjieae]